jgi:hypothetical protein
MHESIEIIALYAASIDVVDAMYTPSAGSDRIASTSQQGLYNDFRGVKSVGARNSWGKIANSVRTRKVERATLS